MPPENKGYDIERIINEDIDLDSTTPHPLPWYPPICDTDLLTSIKLPSKYANMPGLKNPGTKEKFPDESIRIKFLESFGQKEENENIAELGARIKSAMEAQIWPNWLLNTLAANYWRIIGIFENYIDVQIVQVPFRKCRSKYQLLQPSFI